MPGAHMGPETSQTGDPTVQGHRAEHTEGLVTAWHSLVCTQCQSNRLREDLSGPNTSKAGCVCHVQSCSRQDRKLPCGPVSNQPPVSINQSPLLKAHTQRGPSTGTHG